MQSNKVNTKDYSAGNDQGHRWGKCLRLLLRGVDVLRRIGGGNVMVAENRAVFDVAAVTH